MDNPSNNYWCKQGRFEHNVQMLNKIRPIQGFSDNPFINCYTVMANIYFDAYNNGWGGNNEMLERRFKEHVRPIMGDRFGNMKRFYSDVNYLEDSINKVVAKIIKEPSLVFNRVIVMDRKSGYIFLSSSKFKNLEPTVVTSYTGILKIAKDSKYIIEQI